MGWLAKILCASVPISRLLTVIGCLRFLNVKALEAAFNQEKDLVGAFSVITNLRMELFQALLTGGRRCGSSIPPLELGPDCHVAAGSHEARARAANVEREERSPDAVVSSNASKLNIYQSFSVLIVNCNSPTSPIIC